MIAGLIQRNLRIFFRDRMAVFFALLSPLIMLVLYSFFLGNVQVSDLQDAFPHAPIGHIQSFVTSWIFAGILFVTTLTAALAALNVFVEDRASGRFNDFAVSPIAKRQLILGYIGSSFLVTLGISTIVLIAGEGFVRLTGGQLLTVRHAAAAYGYIVLLCACFAALSSFFITFIKSSSAFTSLSVIIGTASGFLAGVYIQPGTLTSGVVNVIDCLPFAQAAALIRGPLTAAAMQKLAGGTGQAKLTAHYAIGNLQIGSHTLGARAIVYILLAITGASIILGAWRLNKKLR